MLFLGQARKTPLLPVLPHPLPSSLPLCTHSLHSLSASVASRIAHGLRSPACTIVFLILTALPPVFLHMVHSFSSFKTQLGHPFLWSCVCQRVSPEALQPPPWTSKPHLCFSVWSPHWWSWTPCICLLNRKVNSWKAAVVLLAEWTWGEVLSSPLWRPALGP